MHIERIVVEDGFLDGLDLSFRPGLNTLIGARGTGKTSIIELIRYCFGLQGHTPESTRKSREHAVSILGSGQVTLTVNEERRSVSISRSADGTSSKGLAKLLAPIIFSQTEIESVGLEPGGRLSLIDAFLPSKQEDSEAAVSAEVLALTSQISAARREIEELQGSLAQLPELQKALEQLRPAEENLSKVSAEAAAKAKAAAEIAQRLSQVAVAEGALQRFRQRTERLHEGLSSLLSSRASQEPWPKEALADPVSSDRLTLEQVYETLQAQLLRVENVRRNTSIALETYSGRRLPLEAQSRATRKEIETLQTGAGEVTRQGQQLRERIAQAQSLSSLVADKSKQLIALTSKRDSFLDSLSTIREQRFLARQGVIKHLNQSLGPRIRIAIQRSGQHRAYATLIADALKGSGIRYNELAPVVAQSLSPRELLEAAEKFDLEAVVEATGISRDRASRFVSALRETQLGRVGTVPMEDSVSLSLLDGKDYKDLTELSTGQRCTVILPIVLRHTDRILVVDQPEDHIDNAFIADTLIRAVSERSEGGQIIFTTHNANIPVLGNADYVVQMGSDGHRGYPLVRDELHAASVVNAISTVMEGGADAFRRRAAFYDDNNS